MELARIKILLQYTGAELDHFYYYLFRFLNLRIPSKRQKPSLPWNILCAISYTTSTLWPDTIARIILEALDIGLLTESRKGTGAGRVADAVSTVLLRSAKSLTKE